MCDVCLLIFYALLFLVSMHLYIVVPHITDAIQDWVTKVAGEPVEKTNQADVCLIEVSKHQQNTTIPLFLLENLTTEWFFFMLPSKILRITVAQHSVNI